jgi:hypothetical protein
MKLALTSNAIPANVPKTSVKAAKAPPAIDGALQDFLKRCPQEQTLTGPLESLGAGSGFSLGAPVQVAPGVEFLPLVSDLVNPDINPNLAADLTSGLSAVADASSGKERAWKVLELAETMPELPRVASATIHALGVLRATLNFNDTRKRAGSKSKNKNEDKIKVSVAAGQVASALFKLITDCPGLESAKPGADRLAAAMILGGKIYLVDQTSAGVTHLGR